MPITFECSCGRKFRTADENAGRSATCPDCRARLVVPAAALAAPPVRSPVLPPPVPVDELPARAGAAFDSQSEEVVPVPRRPADPPPYGRPRRDDPYNRDDDYGRRRPTYSRDDDIDRIVKRPPPARSGGPTNAGALAGMAMMAGAVVWFFGAGLLFDVWFFYPPILFVIGLITFFKGLASGRV